MTTTARQDDSALLIHAYLDGELDPIHVVEMERRLAADPALAAERDRIEALRSVIVERLPRERLPEGLLSRIERAAGVRRERAHPSWQALAAAVILAAVMASGATWFMLRPGPAEASADLIIASHVRALMAPQPIDVSSSDRHTVKPWFNSRIPQSPQVVDLANKGFSLIGGRIDVIGRNAVPTLVYRYRQHLISLVAVPIVSSSSSAERRTIAGYNVLSWNDNGVAYWAVSNLGIGDLDAFAEAFRAASREQ